MADEGQFRGSMGPKVEAAVNFWPAGDEPPWCAHPPKLVDAFRGQAGTRSSRIDRVLRPPIGAQSGPSWAVCIIYTPESLRLNVAFRRFVDPLFVSAVLSPPFVPHDWQNEASSRAAGSMFTGSPSRLRTGLMAALVAGALALSGCAEVAALLSA